MSLTFDFEREMAVNYGSFVAGVDEVGRGPLAGPVVAAAAIIYDFQDFFYQFSDINDSKSLSKKRREFLFEKLNQSSGVQFSIGEASVEEIDQMNIRNATFLAMRRALDNLSQVSAYLVDGNALPNHSLPGKFIIKGDRKSYSIATASILAKVTRDRYMTKLSQEYPGYGWEKNSGYGTKQHSEALQKLGVTPHHRKSFSPVREILELI